MKLDCAPPHISSAVTTELLFSQPKTASYLCPGVPIEFVEMRVEQRTRVETQAATIDLKRYVGTFHD